MFDININAVIFSVIGAILFALGVAFGVFSRKNPKKRKVESEEPKENSKIESSFELKTVYLHKLVMFNLDSALNLLKKLSNLGISAMLVPKSGEIIVQFTSNSPLKNAEQLKRKNLIKKYEIVEVFGDA